MNCENGVQRALAPSASSGSYYGNQLSHSVLVVSDTSELGNALQPAVRIEQRGSLESCASQHRGEFNSKCPTISPGTQSKN